MESFFHLYDKFLALFPAQWHGIVSLAVAIGLIYFIFKLIRQNLLLVIILVIIFFPLIYGSIGTIWESISGIFNYILSKR